MVTFNQNDHQNDHHDHHNIIIMMMMIIIVIIMWISMEASERSAPVTEPCQSASPLMTLHHPQHHIMILKNGIANIVETKIQFI